MTLLQLPQFAACECDPMPMYRLFSTTLGSTVPAAFKPRSTWHSDQHTPRHVSQVTEYACKDLVLSQKKQTGQNILNLKGVSLTDIQPQKYGHQIHAPNCVSHTLKSKIQDLINAQRERQRQRQTEKIETNREKDRQTDERLTDRQTEMGCATARAK